LGWNHVKTASLPQICRKGAVQIVNRLTTDMNIIAIAGSNLVKQYTYCMQTA